MTKITTLDEIRDVFDNLYPWDREKFIEEIGDDYSEKNEGILNDIYYNNKYMLDDFIENHYDIDDFANMFGNAETIASLIDFSFLSESDKEYIMESIVSKFGIDYIKKYIEDNE